SAQQLLEAVLTAQQSGSRLQGTHHYLSHVCDGLCPKYLPLKRCRQDRTFAYVRRWLSPRDGPLSKLKTAPLADGLTRQSSPRVA
ncbi:MAG: hypothetical protein WCC81_08910, partial [Pseudolabrys sp.]